MASPASADAQPAGGTGAGAGAQGVVAASTLELYVVVHKDEASKLGPNGELLRHHYSTPSQAIPHIALRTDAAAAWQHAERFIQGGANAVADYRFVRLTLAAEAVAHFVATSAGAAYRYAPLLQKQTWWPPAGKDWRYWCFHGNLPLGCTGVGF